MATRADYVVSSAITSTSEVNVGTFTVPSQARRIIGIWAVAIGTPEVGKEQFGIVRLDGDALKGITPLKFPIGGSVGVGNVGTAASSEFTQQVKIIPVDIPVEPKASFTAKVTLHDDQETIVYVGVIYE